MKKVIGFIGVHALFFIGDIFCKISYIKTKDGFLFDKKNLRGIGCLLSKNYQRFMSYSHNIQEWASLSEPWKDVT